MRAFIFLILFSLLISACSTGKKFTSRKYTGGRYTSHAKHKDRVSTPVAENQRTVEARVQKEAVPAQSSLKPNVRNEIALSAGNSQVAVAEVKLPRILVKTQSLLEKNKTVQTFQKKTEAREVKKATSTDGSSPKSLLSVFLGAGGLTLDIVGFIVTLITAEYIFMTLLFVGLALGIVALVMGLSGIRQYKQDKRNGEKRRSTLVLGIIGTALGGAAIFAAAYFSLLSLLILAEF